MLFHWPDLFVYTCLNMESHRCRTTCWQRTDLEIGIAEALAGAEGTLDAQDDVAERVLDIELGPHERADLLHGSDHLSRWRRHLHGVHAAGEAAHYIASEWPAQMEHLVLEIVQDLHLEGTGSTQQVPSATVAFLVGIVHVLSQRVLHLEAVLRFEAGEQLEFLDLLGHQ